MCCFSLEEMLSQTGQMASFDLVWPAVNLGRMIHGVEAEPGEFTVLRGNSGRMTIVPTLMGFLQQYLKIAYPREDDLCAHLP